MKSKDILFLCQFFYPEFVTAATLTFDTAEALVEAGHSVDVLCGYPKEYNNSADKIPLKETVNGVNISRLKYLQLSRRSVIGRILNYFSFTLVVLLHLFAFRHYKTVIVYSNPPILPLITVMAKKLFDTKIVFVSYDIYPEIAINTAAINETSSITKAMTMINKMLFKNVEKVVALSQEMKEYILENRSGITEEQVEVIPNWCSTQKTPIQKQQIDNPLFNELNFKNRTVISYFGNMGIAQDMETIYQLVKKHENNDQYLFLFAGHGSKVQTMKDRVAMEGLKHVQVFDYLHGKDFQDALAISDFYIVSLEQGLNGLCVPSKTYNYLSSGKPVIAILDSECDIVRDLNEYEAGLCIKNYEVDKLTELIKASLIGDKHVEMGRNAQRLFNEKYTKEICTDQYIELFDGILAVEKVALEPEQRVVGE